MQLAKILDAFFLEIAEDPNVILHFLLMHEDRLADILNASFCSRRLFQLDFIQSLTLSNQKTWLNELVGIEAFTELKTLLVRQMLYLKCIKPEKYNNVYYGNFVEAVFSSKTFEQYAEKHGKHAVEFDNAFLNLSSKANYYSAIIATYRRYVNAFKPYNALYALSESLFFERLMQYDVFKSMTDAEKYVFIDMLTSLEAHYLTDRIKKSVIDFIKQFVEHESDKEILASMHARIMPISVMHYSIIDAYAHEAANKLIVDIIENSCSVDEFMLSIDLQGLQMDSDSILYLYLYKNDWFKEWKEFNAYDENLALNIAI